MHYCIFTVIACLHRLVSIPSEIAFWTHSAQMCALYGPSLMAALIATMAALSEAPRWTWERSGGGSGSGSAAALLTLGCPSITPHRMRARSSQMAVFNLASRSTSRGTALPVGFMFTCSALKYGTQTAGAPVAEPYLGTRPALYAPRLSGWRGAAAGTGTGVYSPG